ncbi:MAG: TonB-dependent receptor [Pseudomonadota bacterium]
MTLRITTLIQYALATSIGRFSSDASLAHSHISKAVWLLVAASINVVSATSAVANHHGDIEEVIVQATRSNNRVQDQTTRVEVLPQGEVEEKMLMRPGNISTMLNETGGLRVQVTSPALGSANVRTYGMRGRYTQILADGLPLYGGQAASLGLLQIPPSDLRQVEVIKGAASALYGGQSLGGVINLVSKLPSEELEGELIVNATSRDGQDASAYVATPLSTRWSGSLLTTYNRQSAQDLDRDAWIDMSGYERVNLRPRLFYEASAGGNAYLTLGLMSENRRGGTTDDGLVPNGQPFPQNQDTQRFDVGLRVEQQLGPWGMAQLRASSTRQDHKHRFGSLIEEDRHETSLLEVSLAGDLDTTSWITGLAYQSDDYESGTFPAFDYDYDSPAMFAQIDQDLGENLSGAMSVRWDNHSAYGEQLSPRVSLQYRPSDWSFRGSWGRGFYAPTPFIEETEATGLSRVDPFAVLAAETAETLSFDVGYSSGSLQTTMTVFGSVIDDAVRLDAIDSDHVRLVNQIGKTKTWGVEALVRRSYENWTITGNYLYLDTSEPLLGFDLKSPVPLTPEHSAGLVAVWEAENRGRVGLEVYYVGKQTLEGNPYRQVSEPYFFVGLLGEVVLGQAKVFFNLENVLDVRQTREDRLVLPERATDGRWTVDAWSPLDGFVANAGVRFRF